MENGHWMHGLLGPQTAPGCGSSPRWRRSLGPQRSSPLCSTAWRARAPLLLQRFDRSSRFSAVFSSIHEQLQLVTSFESFWYVFIGSKLLNIRAGGLTMVNRTAFSTFKVAIPFACQRKFCFFRLKKLSKINKKIWKIWKITFYHSFGTLPLPINFPFSLTSSLAVSVSWQSFAARSPCCVCWCLLILPFFLLWMPGGSLSFGFSSLCNRYHLCAHYAHSKLAVVPVASSEQILQQRDSLPHVSTGMSLTRRDMPSKIPFWSSPYDK